MSSEKLKGGYYDEEADKPDWKIERERDLARKMKIGRNALGLALAVGIIGVALAHGGKTKEIMSDEERAKNVKMIEVEGIIFSDGVNARKEPYIDDAEPNQLASVGEEGRSVWIDYEGEGYYYYNENDENGGWYGFEAAQLSDELLEYSYISLDEAERLKNDGEDGDGTVWFNEKYVSVEEANTID